MKNLMSGISPLMDVELLKSVVLFSGLEDAELKRLAAGFQLVYLPAGEKVYEAGDESDSFFVVRGAL